MTEPEATSSAEPIGHEQALAEAFVFLADTLVDDYDVVELLDQLVVTCVSLLGVGAAGILLDDQRGSLAVVASSSEETRLLEVFQIQNNEGPCLECVHSSAAVLSNDLPADSARWPRFVPAALAAGFTAVAALPMHLRDQTIGGLNMFASSPVAISDSDRAIAQALADVATIGILNRRSSHRSALVTEQLQFALNSRVTIEQAKGVIAERHGVTMPVAFESLRAHARNHNLKLTEVALSVVGGGEVDRRIVQEAETIKSGSFRRT